MLGDAFEERQVGPGAEPPPGAGDHDDPDVRIRLGLGQPLEVQLLQLDREGVEFVGTVQRDDRDTFVADLGEHELVGHVPTLRGGAVRRSRSPLRTAAVRNGCYAQGMSVVEPDGRWVCV